MVANNMNPQARKQYGIKIRKAREAKKMVKGAVASKMGQPVWVIERIEIGEPVIWHASHYRKLEEVLGISEVAVKKADSKPVEGEVKNPAVNCYIHDDSEDCKSCQ